MIKFVAPCIIFALLQFQSITEATVVQTCTGIQSPIYVNVTGCDVEPCKFVLGTTAEMYLSFVAPFTSNTLVPKATAHLAGVSVPYPLGDNACPNLVNGKCPIQEKDKLLYRFTLPIAGFPEISFVLEFKLEGDGKKPVTCFKVKAAVVKG
ncbi:NPC intracellular cholesterol transporter 2-like [Arctopsyche grandis]|uniref:NPC intracellular cholesterol transporter 2-like n=1 Tax=Arctopsyche grandis TaxID=121162 RepID=UPI00406D8023